jgi:hypothetical protein
LLAIWLLASTKKAPSAAELSRQLGVTVKTAWLMRRKIAQAMARREGELLRRGIVELDEGFIGGKRTRPASRGRLQPGKTMVASAAGSVVQTDAWKGYAALGRARVRPSFPAGCAQALTSISGCPCRTSCSPTSSAGHWISSTASALATCRPTSTSTATGSIATTNARTCSDACSNRCVLYTGPAPYSLLTGT